MRGGRGFRTRLDRAAPLEVGGAAGAPLAAGAGRLILRAVNILLAILLAALSAVLLFAAYDAGALERRWRPAALYLLVGLALAAASCSLVAGS